MTESNNMPAMPIMGAQSEGLLGKEEQIEADKGPSLPSSEKPLDEKQPSDEKPSIIDPSVTSSEVKTPEAPKVGIEVIAERSGFYRQQRIKEGQKFTIKGKKAFGDWFKCIDPILEKQRAKFIKLKKSGKAS